MAVQAAALSAPSPVSPPGPPLGGIKYGLQNFAQAGRTGKGLAAKQKVLEKAQEQLEACTRGQPAKFMRSERQQLKHVKAQLRTLKTGRRMQGFIRHEAGALTVLTSLCMLIGFVSPPVALMGTAGLAIYCFRHVMRYLGYEMPRAFVKVDAEKLLRKHDAELEPGATAGLAEFNRLQNVRSGIFAKVSAGFVVYGAGATLLALAGVAALPVLFLPGAIILLAGAAVVTRLNNVAVPAACVRNHDTFVDRRHFWGKASMLRQIDFHKKEGAIIDEWSKKQFRDTTLDKLRQKFHKAIVWLNYLVYGYFSAKLSAAQHRRGVKRTVEEGSNGPLMALIEKSSAAKATQLREEMAALRVARGKTAALATPTVERAEAQQRRCTRFEQTLEALEAWEREEAALVQVVVVPDKAAVCAAKAEKAAGRGRRPFSQIDLGDAQAARMLWGYLNRRDLLDDVVPEMAASLTAEQKAKPWWHKTGDAAWALDIGVLCDVLKRAEVAADEASSMATAATAALEQDEIDAQHLWKLLRGEGIHCIREAYRTRLQQNNGSLVDQLVDEVRESRVKRAGLADRLR